ncbi:NAD(P)-dependent oxidoreductase [Mariprofundus ferrooxydans]|uniref:6-phosphogluconate dehydrogenase, NAD-binding protein n=1 Tax=Mariprofundus ferrooxydans PV-1 TaxID=314345 RepID=Q0F1Y7_9PROT|nr:NAD(P)-dependent oxidoreductase [Mariprofundus ferrooxydans]EAU55763.1 6-phosphogluconate dehydrogenase, NAD-binding protein [Mariprofundus ferrooxydans PV-1]KON47916.1 6-phosphogluconate dehydrogenase [Mariprofundus ferrooxydans]
MTQNIGFIGLGIMGEAMAANILKQGHPLIVYNRTVEKAAALVDAGAMVADKPSLVADASDVIILMLTGEEAVDAVLFGEEGLLSGDCEGKTVINMSTVPVECSKRWAKELADHGMTLIDAPVSGSKVPAQTGTLVILAGGPEAAVRAQEPLLLSMGKKVIYCGPTGSGSAMKLAINLLLGIMTEGIAEALHLAESSGLASETLLDAVASGPLSCTLFHLKEEMFKTGNYPPQFPFKHMAKDMQFVLAAAAENGAHLPLGTELAKLFSPAADADLQEQDFAAVKTLLERR